MADMLEDEALAALGLGPDGALGWNKLPGGGGGGAAGPPFDGAAAAWAHTSLTNTNQSHLVITPHEAQTEIKRADLRLGRSHTTRVTLQGQASALSDCAKPNTTGCHSCRTECHQQQHSEIVPPLFKRHQ